MIAADSPDRPSGKLMVVDAHGGFRHRQRADLAALFQPGDVVVANDAATLPASLRGTHAPSGDPIEIRLAGWVPAGGKLGMVAGDQRQRSAARRIPPGSVVGRDAGRFIAIAFGQGDHRTPTEDRPPPPALFPGDRIQLGPLVAVVNRLLNHPRLLVLCFLGTRADLLAGLARHGRPIQYAHVPKPLALWDVWTNLAADPVAFEPPSAGFALDWRLLSAWRRRGITLTTLTHAAGISSTGDPTLDRRLPFDEPYTIPPRTAASINRAMAKGGRIVAIGTTVVRALESAAKADGIVKPGSGFASGRIGQASRLRIVDAILTGMHQPGESHFELLRAFADAQDLNRATSEATERGYRAHEFGDVMLIERREQNWVGGCRPTVAVAGAFGSY